MINVRQLLDATNIAEFSGEKGKNYRKAVNMLPLRGALADE
jgi:hypothetical protein